MLVKREYYFHRVSQGKRYVTIVVSLYHISEILTPDKDLVQKIVKLGARKLLVLTGRTQTERILQNELKDLILP